MSHVDTTQSTPQWAIDAVNLIYEDYQLVYDHERECGPMDLAQFCPDDFPALAAIIARHADARLAELEADNARVRDGLAYCAGHARMAAHLSNHAGHLASLDNIADRAEKELGK